MEIKWKLKARQRLEQAYTFYNCIAGPRTAQKIRNSIVDAVAGLAANPYLGHLEYALAGSAYPYRSLVAHKYYKIIYRVEGTTVWIITIWDCRMDLERMNREIEND